MEKSVRRTLRQMERIRIRSAEERMQQILDERAERLAARQNEASAPTEALPRALVCGAGRERFGLRVEVVAEVGSPVDEWAAEAGRRALERSEW